MPHVKNPPTSPYQRPLWRAAHSLWLLPLLSAGLFSWTSFAYIGLRTRNRRWLVAAAIYALPTVVFWAVPQTLGPNQPNPRFDQSVAVVLTFGLIALIHAWVIRREYFVRLEAIAFKRERERASGTDPQQVLEQRIAKEYGLDATFEAVKQHHSRLHSRVPFQVPLAAAPRPEAADRGSLARYQLALLLHRLALGARIDLTDPTAELADPLAEAEQRKLIVIDVAQGTYVLTPDGRQALQRMRDEAQALIRTYDLYGDVDTVKGEPRFGTGAGHDLRVAVWEYENKDAFYARFVIGLSEGEWDDRPDWTREIGSEAWFDEVFAPVACAETVDATLLRRVIGQGHAQSRPAR